MVGYLSKKDAPLYQSTLNKLAESGKTGVCAVVINGGWHRSDAVKVLAKNKPVLHNYFAISEVGGGDE
jgi:hypothetical protein